MKLSFNGNHGWTIIPAFNSLISVTNKSRRGAGNDIYRTSYAGGNSLYCFEIEPNFGDNDNYISLLKQGNVHVLVLNMYKYICHWASNKQTNKNKMLFNMYQNVKPRSLFLIFMDVVIGQISITTIRRSVIFKTVKSQSQCHALDLF
jgi:hypothetical protein